MLRLNLSTRPFYNERGLHVGLGLAGLVLAVVTALNAWQLVSLSSRQTMLAGQAAADEARAADLRRQAQQDATVSRTSRGVGRRARGQPDRSADVSGRCSTRSRARCRPTMLQSVPGFSDGRSSRSS
jgi:hypothetical protein